MRSLKPLYEAPSRRVFSLSMVVALTLGMLATPAAQAIPPNQRDFNATTVRTTNSTTGVPVPGTFVTVNNDVPRTCVIQFSADAISTVNDLVLVGYTVDSASPAACTQTGGPGGFAGVGASTAVWVRAIPRGLHTIRACFGVGDLEGNGGRATLLTRSLTVECRTQ